MLVRINFGWKAGRVEDIEPSAARLMLADGRASAVNHEEALPQSTQSAQRSSDQVSSAISAPSAVKTDSKRTKNR
jgi:hypothetical protein